MCLGEDSHTASGGISNSRDGLIDHRAWKKKQVQYDLYGLDMTAGFLWSHFEAQCNVFQSLVLNKDLGFDKEYTVTHHADPINLYKESWGCPFPCCVGKASTKWNLRQQFNDCHPGYKISIPSKSVLQKCFASIEAQVDRSLQVNGTEVAPTKKTLRPQQRHWMKHSWRKTLSWKGWSYSSIWAE